MNTIWDGLYHALLHALEDTGRMLPFLFAAYLLVEYMEHRSTEKLQRMLSGSPWSPVVGGFAGMLPQCGFSAASANLYNKGVITTGTLIAVFISTSDEALPMLLSAPENYPVMLRLFGIKLTLGIVSGLFIDLLVRHKVFSGYWKEEPTPCCCNHQHRHHSHGILTAAFLHTLGIGFFIFVVTLVLGAAIELAGEETIASMMMTGSLAQPFMAGLVGFIPNCAASVIITQLLIDGTVSLGSAVAGLSTGAGVGMLVLARGCPSKKKLLRILALLYAISVSAGVIIDIIL